MILWLPEVEGCLSALGAGFKEGFQCDECTDRQHVFGTCWMILEGYYSDDGSLASSKSSTNFNVLWSFKSTILEILCSCKLGYIIWRVSYSD